MSERLTRTQVTAATENTGWRLLVGVLAVSVPVSSLGEGLEVAGLAKAVCAADADDHLLIDLRSRRVELRLTTMSEGHVGRRDVELAAAITAALDAAGKTVAAPTGIARPVQVVELAIDAIDIPAVRPFWKAVLAYVDEPEPGPPDQAPEAIVDPAGQGPSIWFQQMDSPRPQRNRIHFDVIVTHDEGQGRVEAALAAGGTLLSDDRARAFWVLADPEGNEVCVCTWQDRDGDQGD